MFSIIKPFTSRENGLIIAEIHDLLQHEMNIGQPIRFAYFIFNKSQDEKPVIYSNYPKDWVEKYMKNELYKQDPILLVASQKIMSFPWHKNYFKKTNVRKAIFSSKVQNTTSPVAILFRCTIMKIIWLC
ncbi:hypothetical protein SODG_005811 [Sodalis praecaptivus]